MLPMAAYLYYLKSYGVSGDILECGAFKGGSTICLSWMCKYFGITLYCADSFEGLPDYDGGGYYKKGDFCGSLEEVSDNVRKYGCLDNVVFIKGYFAQSLKCFNKSLSLLWLDVDMEQSVVDVLDNMYGCLSNNAVIFCDGLGQFRDFKDDYLIPASGESRGLLQYMNKHNISYKACYSGVGYGGIVVPDCSAAEYLLYNQYKMRWLMRSLRNPSVYRLLLARRHRRLIKIESDSAR